MKCKNKNVFLQIFLPWKKKDIRRSLQFFCSARGAHITAIYGSLNRSQSDKSKFVENSSRQFNFFKTSLIVIPQLHAWSSSPHLHWRVWIERIDFCLFRQVCFRAINVKLFIFIGFRVTFGAAMVIWCKASLFIIITISSLKDSKYNLVT